MKLEELKQGDSGDLLFFSKAFRSFIKSERIGFWRFDETHCMVDFLKVRFCGICAESSGAVLRRSKNRLGASLIVLYLVICLPFSASNLADHE